MQDTAITLMTKEQILTTKNFKGMENINDISIVFKPLGISKDLNAGWKDERQMSPKFIIESQTKLLEQMEDLKVQRRANDTQTCIHLL